MQGRLTTAGTPLELGDYRSNMNYRNIWMSTAAKLDSNSRDASNSSRDKTPFRKVLVLAEVGN
jgi:hypothetical protein